MNPNYGNPRPRRGTKFRIVMAVAVPILVIAGSVHRANADVTISSDATQNMNCANGVCAPIASDAVLNVTDLENLLASGNVDVTTTGSGVQAKDIVVKVALVWSATNTLGLDAYRSITVDQPVSVQGLSGLTLTTNDGAKNGELSFSRKGNITFANLSSNLTINGLTYTLINTIKGLASAVQNNPYGDYAFAQSYDAKKDDTYGGAPVGGFSGTFEGLGNAVTHFTQETKRLGASGLFASLGQIGVIRDFGLLEVNETLSLGLKHEGGGALLTGNDGLIIHCYVSGSFSGVKEVIMGGLAAENSPTGQIIDSYAAVAVTASSQSAIGGLVGKNGGVIANSFSTGAVTEQNDSIEGGLVGENNGGTISNSYATGSVTVASGGLDVGGLVGYNTANISPISQSYSTGAVSGGSYEGGLIGYDSAESGSLTYTYWDTDTSGITNLSQGAGYPADDPGIMGLTSAQLQSGLPSGFDPMVWAENPKINNGFPYLIANPPKK